MSDPTSRGGGDAATSNGDVANKPLRDWFKNPASVLSGLAAILIAAAAVWTAIKNLPSRSEFHKTMCEKLGANLAKCGHSSDAPPALSSLPPSVGPSSQSRAPSANAESSPAVSSPTSQSPPKAQPPVHGYNPVDDERLINNEFVNHGHYLQGNRDVTISGLEIHADSVTFRLTNVDHLTNSQLLLQEYTASLADLDPVLNAVPSVGGDNVVLVLSCRPDTGRCFNQPPGSKVFPGVPDMADTAAAHLATDADILEVRRAFSRLVSPDHSDAALCNMLARQQGPKCPIP